MIFELQGIFEFQFFDSSAKEFNNEKSCAFITTQIFFF